MSRGRRWSGLSSSRQIRTNKGEVAGKLVYSKQILWVSNTMLSLDLSFWPGFSLQL